MVEKMEGRNKRKEREREREQSKARGKHLGTKGSQGEGPRLGLREGEQN